MPEWFLALRDLALLAVGIVFVVWLLDVAFRES